MKALAAQVWMDHGKVAESPSFERGVLNIPHLLNFVHSRLMSSAVLRTHQVYQINWELFPRRVPRADADF